MRILIVEDEHRIANSLKKGLEQERYAIDVAYDGRDGYDLASSEEYDCLILDLEVTDKEGDVQDSVIIIKRRLNKRVVTTIRDTDGIRYMIPNAYFLEHIVAKTPIDHP